MSCRKDSEVVDSKIYHVFIVAGQSNAYYGVGFDPILDAPEPRVQQLGRHEGVNLKVILAKMPLQHHSKVDNKIGFALTFAKLYKKAFLELDEEVLLIPAASTGSSFKENDWTNDGVLYKDLVKRIRYVKAAFPNAIFKGMLWHQGESDRLNDNYQTDLDVFIVGIRSEIGNPNLPFILGGMVPFWVATSERLQKVQNIIKNTPNRINRTAYADPEWPFLIEKDSNEVDQIHFDAAGQRELGKRYFDQFVAIF